MPAYVSCELSCIQMLDPKRHEIALKVEAFLRGGGEIEIGESPRFDPHPPRHEPPPSKKATKPKPVKEKAISNWLDRLAQRDIEREERAAQRNKDEKAQIEHIRELAKTLCCSDAVLRTGLTARTLLRLSKKGDFKFQPAAPQKRLAPLAINEERDAKNAERIKAFKELGLTMNQAREGIGATYRAFTRLLEKFDIDYPKAHSGPAPAFFPKNKEES